MCRGARPVPAGCMGVVSCTMRASSSSSSDHGAVSVKRSPAGGGGLKTRVSPPLTPSRADEKHGHQVYPVAVGALGRGPANAIDGIDSELVRLDEPLGLRGAANTASHTRAKARSTPFQAGRPGCRAAWAQTSAPCRRAGRCIPPAASGRGGAPCCTSPPCTVMEAWRLRR